MKKKMSHEVFPFNPVDRSAVLKKMSSHYRRIYNVKPAVNSDMPVSAKVSRHCKNLDRTPRCSSVRDLHQPLSQRIELFLNNVDVALEQPEPNFLHSTHTQHSICTTPVQARSKVKNTRVYSAPQSQRKRRPPSAALTTILPVKETDSLDSAYQDGWSSQESPPMELPFLSKSWSTKPRIYNKEREYIQFQHALLSEALEKCIYSNRGLKQLFDAHLEHAVYKHLDQKKLQSALDELKIQIGIPTNGAFSDKSFNPHETGASNKTDDLGTVDDIALPFAELDLDGAIAQEVLDTLISQK